MDEIELFKGLSLENQKLFAEQLASIISNWLNKGQIEKISYYLYRIDVSEFHAQKVLNAPMDNNDKALKLAELMIERHLKKLNQRP